MAIEGEMYKETKESFDFDCVFNFSKHNKIETVFHKQEYMCYINDRIKPYSISNDSFMCYIDGIKKYLENND